MHLQRISAPQIILPGEQRRSLICKRPSYPGLTNTAASHTSVVPASNQQGHEKKRIMAVALVSTRPLNLFFACNGDQCFATHHYSPKVT